MPRKSSTAVAHGAPALALVSPSPAVAPAATDSNVTARKRARRARVAAMPVAPPVIVKPEIDLTRPDAKKALTAAFPVAVKDSIIDATEADDLAALAYIEARDAEARAQGAKEASANRLRYALGKNETIIGKGWKATWKGEKGDVDWGALAKELNIESSVIERFRKPGPRVLRVTETVEK